MANHTTFLVGLPYRVYEKHLTLVEGSNLIKNIQEAVNKMTPPESYRFTMGEDWKAGAVAVIEEINKVLANPPKND
jgi:hypothetical protein